MPQLIYQAHTQQLTKLEQKESQLCLLSKKQRRIFMSSTCCIHLLQLIIGHESVVEQVEVGESRYQFFEGNTENWHIFTQPTTL